MDNEELIKNIQDWLKKRGFADSTVRTDLWWIQYVLDQNLKTSDATKSASRYRRGQVRRALRQIDAFNSYKSKQK